jgi:broad specificity phosphatase PhoE
MKLRNNQYFILRHGESLSNIKRVISCWPEKFYYPLTFKGRKEIKEAAKKLKKRKINLIFSSDLLRTKQSAEIIAKELGIKEIFFDKRLREVNFGILNGKLIKETEKFWDREGKLSSLEYYSKKFQIAPPKGEDYYETEKRIFDFLKEIDKMYKSKNILIISHSHPLILLEKVVYGYDLKKFVKIIVNRKKIKTGEVRKLLKRSIKIL